MTKMQQLVDSTAAQRVLFRNTPVIARAMAGDVTLALYADFLTEAYHHVRHTVPLLMAVGARLPGRLAWLQKEIVHYAEEEIGHDEWILADLEALGRDAGVIRSHAPAIQTDAMLAYAYDIVMRRNPIGFFGMVHVLEGTSAAFALAVAASVQRTLALPDSAMTYLRSHGHLDQQHVGDFAAIVERLDAETDLPAVVDCAGAMYWLYGNIFRMLEERHQSYPSADVRKRA